MRAPDPKPAGTWDFYGACAPDDETGMASRRANESFTLGCFQWVPMARGEGTKAGKVQKRIRGASGNPAAAFNAARAYCAERNGAPSEEPAHG